MHALVETASGRILAIGAFPTPPADPGIVVVTLAEAALPARDEPGIKTLNADGTISVDQTAYWTTQQAQQQADQAEGALRQWAITTAQSTVGLSVSALTLAQIKAMLAWVVYQHGMVDKNGVVTPTSQWH